MPLIKSNVFTVTINRTNVFGFGTVNDITVYEQEASQTAQDITSIALGAPAVTLGDTVLKYYSDSSASIEIGSGDSGYTVGETGMQDTLNDIVAITFPSTTSIRITVDTSNVGLGDTDSPIVFYGQMEVDQDDP